MTRKRKKFKFPKLKWKKFILGSLLWSLGVFVFIAILIFIMTPLYVWQDTYWLTINPPLFYLEMLIIPIMMCIFVGTSLRFLYYIYKGKPMI